MVASATVEVHTPAEVMNGESFQSALPSPSVRRSFTVARRRRKSASAKPVRQRGKRRGYLEQLLEPGVGDGRPIGLGGIVLEEDGLAHLGALGRVHQVEALHLLLVPARENNEQQPLPFEMSLVIIIIV